MLRKAFVLMAAMLVSLPAKAIPPAGWSLNAILSTTDNLYHDSLGLGDHYAGFSLSLEQPVSEPLLLWYQGSGEIYGEYTGLNHLQHSAGIDWGTYLTGRSELWATLYGRFLGYGSEYESYDQTSGSVIGGYRLVANPALRVGSTVSWKRVGYPHADSVAINYDDSQLSLDINFATRYQLAFDVEIGVQRRSYYQIEGGTSTDFLWNRVRVSTPLAQGTGLALSITYREQLFVDGEDLLALYEGGLNPESQLWDGWRVGAEVNHGQGLWKFTGGVQAGRANYLETEAITGREARVDDVFRVMLMGRRSLLTPINAPAASLGMMLVWTDNNSSDTYYDWSGYSLHIVLSLLSP